VQRRVRDYCAIPEFHCMGSETQCSDAEAAARAWVDAGSIQLALQAGSRRSPHEPEEVARIAALLLRPGPQDGRRGGTGHVERLEALELNSVDRMRRAGLSV